MRKSIKVLFLSSVLALTAACQDTLDTSSDLAKKQSIKQMMVGIYPQNQKIFKHALKTIYLNDQKVNANLNKDEVLALTDLRLKGKTVEDILHLSFQSNKTTSKLPVVRPASSTLVANNVNVLRSTQTVKTHLKTQ